MALYSDNVSLQGPAQKFTLHSTGRQSLVTAPFIVEVSPVSEHEISLTWQVSGSFNFLKGRGVNWLHFAIQI